VEELLFDGPHRSLVAVKGRDLSNAMAHLPRTNHREPHRGRSLGVERRTGVKGVVSGGCERSSSDATWVGRGPDSAPDRFRGDRVGVLGSFVVVPEPLERKGYNPRSGFVRCFVWAYFLLVVFVPAAISGFLFSVRNVADWAYLAVGLLVAILYDYYRLNPEKVPWVRSRNLKVR